MFIFAERGDLAILYIRRVQRLCNFIRAIIGNPFVILQNIAPIFGGQIPFAAKRVYAFHLCIADIFILKPIRSVEMENSVWRADPRRVFAIERKRRNLAFRKFKLRPASCRAIITRDAMIERANPHAICGVNRQRGDKIGWDF